MIMPYIDSYLLALGLKIPLSLYCIFLVDALLEVYILQDTVVIHEDCCRTVVILGMSALQFFNESWSG